MSDSRTYCSSSGAGLASLKRADTPFRPPSLLLETYPPEHERFRVVVARALSPVNLRKLCEMVEKGASETVNKVAKLKTFDVVRCPQRLEPHQPLNPVQTADKYTFYVTKHIPLLEWTAVSGENQLRAQRCSFCS